MNGDPWFPHGPATSGNLRSVPKRGLLVRQATTTLESRGRCLVTVSVQYGHVVNMINNMPVGPLR
jgi:hypothetical protein